MARTDSIIRLTLIIRKLKSRPSSFEEIEDFLDIEAEIYGYDFSLSKRTFQRDIQDIASIFSLEIKYDPNIKAYRIIEENPANERLIEAFNIFSALETKERIPDIMFFEDRKPLGLEHLHGLLHAIKNKKAVEFNYQKYWEGITKKRLISPYGLKEFNQRWYLVGLNHEDQKIKIFGLDRLSDLNIMNLDFIETDFKLSEYFKYCFGIIRPDGKDDKPEKVVLRFNAFKGRYIKSLPLHHSQRIVRDDEHDTIVELHVYLTHDFKMEVLSHGHEAKVLEPAHFGKEIEEELLKNLTQYK
jgi:predicted DNA-binding transcriptional regulator YafY